MPEKTLNRPAATASRGQHVRRRTAGWPDEADRFSDRTEAGRILGAMLAGQLKTEENDRPLVLGLPRGGIMIACEVASALDADLDVVIAQKIGLPWQPAFGVGAVADDGPVVYDQGALAASSASVASLTPAVRRERLAIDQRRQRYRGNRPAPEVAGRTVVIADDGLTLDVMTRAAVRAIRAGQPRRLVYAAPVCAAETADWLLAEADEVVHLHSPRVFHALGLWYRTFTPVSDNDVANVLANTWRVDTAPSVG